MLRDYFQPSNDWDGFIHLREPLFDFQTFPNTFRAAFDYK